MTVQELQVLRLQIENTTDIRQLKALCKRFHTVMEKHQQFALGCVIYEMFTGVQLETMGGEEAKTAAIARQLGAVEPLIADIIGSLLDLNQRIDLQQVSQQLK